MTGHIGPDAGPAHALLVSSSGGHLSQLLALKEWYSQRRCTWVTFDTLDARTRLEGKHVLYASFPTTRNLPNAVRNLQMAMWVLPRLRPDVVVSTGAGVALPFFMVARLLGIPTVYVEVYDRVDSRTLTGRLCYPLARAFLVQWPDQLRLYPKAKLIGPLLGGGLAP